MSARTWLHLALIRAFCASLSTWPADSNTWFLEGNDIRPLTSKLSACLPP